MNKKFGKNLVRLAVKKYSSAINKLSFRKRRKQSGRRVKGFFVRGVKKIRGFSVLRSVFALISSTFIFVILVIVFYASWIDRDVREKFEGKRWDIPAQAFARALEIHPGKKLALNDLVFELKLLGYAETKKTTLPGSYNVSQNTVELKTREFIFWDGKEKSRHLLINFNRNHQKIVRIKDINGMEVVLARLDPMPIGYFYPGKAEDRLLIKLSDLPDIIPQALVAVEDKKFYSHFGINPLAILRALIANIRAGKTVQGGSTITQQLAKNFFLNSERSLTRKFKEAVTAVLLEIHYSKEEIIETYLNEVYLAQNGEREIHGIAMASMFYFGCHPKDLNTAQAATLIGLLKGPSKYNPRRNPDTALARRNLVLDILAKDEVISTELAQKEKARPLQVKAVPDRSGAGTPYPDFMGLVKKQILRDYNRHELKTEGIRVFTTLDPIAQHKVEQAVNRQMPLLDRKATFARGELKPAVVSCRVETGEAIAVVGSLDFRKSGFNRAVTTRRNIGSLIKPVIYMTALEQADKFTLSSPISDAKIRISYNGVSWAPDNYDRREHGNPMLIKALANSYNLATARLGAKVKIDAIIKKLRILGFPGKIGRYPSILLGAVEMSADEVAQLYLVLANKGFKVPLRSIRSVINKFGEPLKNYTVEVEQVMDEKTAFLTYYAMREVVKSGTAKSINKHFDSSYNIAGKTGTSNKTRDSWFAGFGGNLLTVSWIGRDDNRPTNLSGSNGALPLWITIMKKLGLSPYIFSKPMGIEFKWVHAKTGKLSDQTCKHAFILPYVAGTSPFIKGPCNPGVAAYLSPSSPSPANRFPAVDSAMNRRTTRHKQSESEFDDDEYDFIGF